MKLLINKKTKRVVAVVKDTCQYDKEKFELKSLIVSKKDEEKIMSTNATYYDKELKFIPFNNKKAQIEEIKTKLSSDISSDELKTEVIKLINII